MPTESQPEEPLDPCTRVERFRSIASREAFRLACHLAAVPLTLPIMRIVQQQICRRPWIEDLGEVLASGLLERLTSSDAPIDPDAVLYDFVDGVRDVLLGALPMESVFDIRTRVQSALKEFIERQLGRAIGNFRAFVLDEHAEYTLPSAVEAFVEIERNLLQRLRPRGPRRVIEGVKTPNSPTLLPAVEGEGWSGRQTGSTVRFWGVRGSIPCPGPDTVRYGGNTCCVEIRCGGHLMVFDAGTGLRELGQELIRTGQPVELDLFYSSTHFDHTWGLPFFAPCYDARSKIRIWAGHLKGKGIEAVLKNMMIAPLFPIPMAIFAAKIEFIDFSAGDVLVPHPGIRLGTGPLNHPNGATGYRLEHGGKVVAYIAVTEHRPEALDVNVLRLIDDADVMIYDASYTDAEFPSHRKWGHSTWQEGMRLADAAGVKTLVIFHHDPGHDDAFMDQVAADAAAAPGSPPGA